MRGERGDWEKEKRKEERKRLTKNHLGRRYREHRVKRVRYRSNSVFDTNLASVQPHHVQKKKRRRKDLQL